MISGESQLLGNMFHPSYWFSDNLVRRNLSQKRGVHIFYFVDRERLSLSIPQGSAQKSFRTCGCNWRRRRSCIGRARPGQSWGTRGRHWRRRRSCIGGARPGQSGGAWVGQGRGLGYRRGGEMGSERQHECPREDKRTGAEKHRRAYEKRS